jgi:hypothetical protein
MCNNVTTEREPSFLRDENGKCRAKQEQAFALRLNEACVQIVMKDIGR